MSVHQRDFLTLMRQTHELMIVGLPGDMPAEVNHFLDAIESETVRALEAIVQAEQDADLSARGRRARIAETRRDFDRRITQLEERTVSATQQALDAERARVLAPRRPGSEIDELRRFLRLQEVRQSLRGGMEPLVVETLIIEAAQTGHDTLFDAVAENPRGPEEFLARDAWARAQEARIARVSELTGPLAQKRDLYAGFIQAARQIVGAVIDPLAEQAGAA